jgi:hypothetical protein
VSYAKNLLRSRSASAVALLRAADIVLGDAWLAWEPESIWLELERQEVVVPAEARDRLMAGVALRLVPSFYWDGMVFSKTCVAFDGHPAHVDIVEEAAPSAMAWSAVEAAWIRDRYSEQSLSFEHEPVAYAAVVLDRAGFVLAPSQLSFAQTELDRRLPKSDLIESVRKKWDSLDKSALENVTLEETRIDVQVARLAAVELHVRTRRAEAEAELARLS